MSPEERELERQAILEQFGPGVGAILQRAKQNREMRRNEQEGSEFEREIEQTPGSPGELLFGMQTFVSSYGISSHATQ
jgi:hypothetical protein